MLKRILPITLALIAFLVVLLLLSPAPQVKVAVAAKDLVTGHTLSLADMVIKEYPKESVPADAIKDPGKVVGLKLQINRAQGDILRLSAVGEQALALQPNERALAIEVNNASGLAGLLKPGDLVGVNAIVESTGIQKGTYSKSAVENLRVLYLSPEFTASDPQGLTKTDSKGNTVTVKEDRKDKGVVVLAVPIEAETVIYDFSEVQPALGRKVRVVNVVELLTALDAADNAELFLFLMPLNSKPMTTSGLWLPDLVILPYLPTPTINPEGFVVGTPQPGGGQ